MRRLPASGVAAIVGPAPAATEAGRVIHYHGGPVTPHTAALALWKRRHAMVSFHNPRQVELAAEVCQSFTLDNGAFSLWRTGREMDVEGYAAWVAKWRRHPGFDFAVIPDVIDGTEQENDVMVARWWNAGGSLTQDVPVWHLHESFDRLIRLAYSYPRVALGSSGAYSEPGADEWWQRMGEAMDAVCDENGMPPCKLHGLRMLNPTIFSQLPLASADSTNVARNIGIDMKWDAGPYVPRSKEVRALVLADRIEHHCSAARWVRTFGTQMNMELIG
jgi:hypothetical protein